MQTNKKYVLPTPESITLTGAAVEKLISSKNPAAALLYIYILKNNGELSVQEAAETLGLGAGIYSAFEELARLKLISSEPREIIERDDTPPEYSTEDIERSIQGGSSFGPLVRELQHILGNVLSGSALKVFFGIYDYLGIPAEVILLLTAYCVEKNQKRYGGTRKISASFIEKEAYNWARNDIFSLEAAEAHIKKQNERGDTLELVKNALRIKKRSLAPSEEKHISSWLDMGFLPDAIELAYDRTVLQTGSLAWAYMNKILTNWHNNGLHTIAEINEGDNLLQQKKNKDYKAVKEEKPDMGEIENMKKYLDKLRSEKRENAK